MAGMVRHLFGEIERDFLLTIGTAEELEETRAEALRKLGYDAGQAGVMAIFTRLTTNTWVVGDLRSVLRLSLVGAGMERETATRLVDRELTPGNMSAWAVLASKVLGGFLIGDPEDSPGGDAKKAEGAADPIPAAAPMDGSAGAGSTDRAPPWA